VLFRSVFASRPKNACSRFFCRCASRVSLYFCPRRLLQGLQAGTRLSIESLPPASCSMRWSASVAGCPHQWHGGLCASSWRLAWLYWGVRFLLVMSGFLLCVECSCLPPTGAPPRGGLPSLCVWTCLGACPPHFVLVALAAGCLTPMDGHHSHL
jgi:hypothetical protein